MEFILEGTGRACRPGRATRETPFSRTPDPSLPRSPDLRTRTPDGWETRETPWETSCGEPRTGFEENC